VTCFNDLDHWLFSDALLAETYERWHQATTEALAPQRVLEGTIGKDSPASTCLIAGSGGKPDLTACVISGFMLHISGHISLTAFALEHSGVLHGMSRNVTRTLTVDTPNR
jgi:hypothetical protein